ncbi:homoserine O-acetyltransferase MetA [Bilifractor sp. LCP19S3_H10]|uniref:homoserine O-acetyltransferase MetA n=1 Tax=Bilifractor sp. LCP19S3_H10 TaxID=3438736 RepID=UPI003F92CC74
MPIKIQNDIPVKEVLEKENIFVMDEDRAIHQDIRPLQILILNLMPLKEDTELQLLRCLSNSPLQIDITFMVPASHHVKNTSISHIQKFYVTFEDICREYYDGMIVTGAPVELMEFEEVDYWDELCEIMDWSEKHVTSTMYQCWGAQAAMYHFYGIQKRLLDHKMFGLFEHQIHKRKIPLVRGFDDVFLCPHSRHTEIPMDELLHHPEITVLTDSDEAGFFLGMADDGRKVFVQGHPEYDRMTLDREYKRDLAKGMDIAMPENYYPDDDPEKKPLLTWRATSAALYANWINYYVYQVTPYDMYGTPDFR